MENGTFEPTETREVTALLDQADVLLNIGANIGYYCCIALQKGKEVIAFEPLEANLRSLYRNIQLNGWSDRIEVFPTAVGDRVGLLEIYGAGTGASLVEGWAGQNSSDSTTVPITSLDHVLQGRLSGRKVLVVLDVEGAEIGVLRGASAFLTQQPRPTWMVEISITEHQPEGVGINPHLVDTFEHFFSRGYRAETVTEAPRKVEMEEVRRIAEGGEDTLLTHNFVFRTL